MTALEVASARDRRLFLFAYACSGFAGLIYQLIWVRLLTLYLGHTTAAVSTVVAAFMCGLAAGSALGGRLASRLTKRQALSMYIGLEAFVAFVALVVPLEVKALLPLLQRAYEDGSGGLRFGLIRLLSSFILVLIPAAALGATFPSAARWFADDSDRPGRDAGALYAVNTAGATAGVLAAGFALIPVIGTARTTLVAVAASIASIACVLLIRRRSRSNDDGVTVNRQARGHAAPGARRGRAAARTSAGIVPDMPIVAGVVLGLTGAATFVYEIAWVRVLSLIIGPTTYAVAATLAAVIGGTACGSIAGTWLAGRLRAPAYWLGITLGATAIAASWTAAYAGTELPRVVAMGLVEAPAVESDLLMRHVALVAALLLPTAIGLGVAFPLALQIAGGGDAIARRIGLVYAVNTVAGVAGSLAAGFLAIPFLGLQQTLQIPSVVLVVAALIAAFATRATVPRRVAALAAAAAAIAVVIGTPAWDRELLASGVYKYPANLADGADLDTSVRGGQLLYYRDGAAATVSVKELAGTRALSIDGKVDASTAADMLTQKALAHVPLLLHSAPRTALVIGLGSGVTAASALVHPLARLDVVEISPEVVEASRHFARENRNVLDDPRTGLIVADGRSHLLLADTQYDVIISEPSNPWIAGVAALFTREFFLTARERLAPGGIICQWAHTYDITEHDFRSIVATFLSVFPDGTLWTIGEGDVLLVASTSPLDDRLEAFERAWDRPGVAADLGGVGAVEPFMLLASFAGGGRELARYAAGAPLHTDDRMALEFTGPRALYAAPGAQIASTLRQLRAPGAGPAVIDAAFERASAVQWRNHGAMLLAMDAANEAYRSYSMAFEQDPRSGETLQGLVRAAIAADREPELMTLLQGEAAEHPGNAALKVAISRLLATGGAFDEAIAVAREATALDPRDTAPLEQLASIFADVGDAEQLEATVARLQQVQPEAPTTLYYEAQARFHRGRFGEAAALAERAARGRVDARAWNLAGASYASIGDRDRARAAFVAALDADPRDAAIYTNLGVLELESNNVEKAADYFSEALALDPSSETARQGLAQTR